MSTYEIPLSPTPQKLSISLGGIQYRLTVQWNRVMTAWVLDIADVGGNDILTGLPIVPGVDMLGQFAYLGFGGMLIAQTDSISSIIPTFTSLGITGHLYWVTA